MNHDSISKEMEYFFPSIWNDITGFLQMTLPIFTRRFPEEENIFKKYVKNLKLETRINNSAARNCYTYPLSESAFGAQFGGITFLYKVCQGYLDITPEWLKASVKNGIVVYPKNYLNMLTFETKGLVSVQSKLSEKHRVAILLHEIGHWYNAHFTAYAVMFNMFKSIPPLTLIMTILLIVVGRKNEYGADRYSNALGYGGYLSEALEIISLDVRQNVSWYNQMGDWLTKILSIIHNFIDVILPISHHPSLNKRQDELMKKVSLESYLHEQNISYSRFEKPLLKVCREVDSRMKGKVDLIFPINK